MPSSKNFVATATHAIGQASFSHWGWAKLRRPTSLNLYREWLEQGHHASMTYLERHLPQKENPSSMIAVDKAVSALVVAKGYLPHPYPHTPEFSPRTALYAQGRDYHLEFQQELERVAQLLRAEFPEDQFLCFTDSAPILERDLAVQAGLGWVGKNTCVIHPQKGSLFFIGEILTTRALLEPEAISIPDMCGTCDRCIRACPTQALEAPRVLNARKCIAYWTIEARTPAPESLRPQFGDWFFGCDICQTVCPWNEKAFGKESMRRLSQTPQPLQPESNLLEDLREILEESNQALKHRFAAFPQSRARALGLKRNALYVIGNRQLRELTPTVEGLLLDPDLGSLARWTLTCLLDNV